ncbi:MAG TPA: prepilin peptidase [Clostridia bacterium]
MTYDQVYELIINIYVGIFGLMIGSFLNVCIYRIPLGESIVAPHSHCTSCNRKLGPLDLIPLFSYVFLRGRCRYCKEKISPRYPTVETATAVVFLILYAKYGLTVDFASFAFLMSILITVFMIDIDKRIIPGNLVVIALAAGILVTVYNVIRPFGIYGDHNWWNPIAGFMAGSGFLLLTAVLGFILFKTDEAMGIGDVKIFAPIGIFLGWKMTIMAIAVALLTAGISCLFIIALKKKGFKETVPFGPFLIIGTFITIVWGWNLLSLFIR